MSVQNPHTLRIFTIISQIEQLLESAPKPKLGAAGRRLLDVDEIFDLLGDLKVTIPEDIRRANSVLIEADTLLDHANQDAVDIIDQANLEANSLREQARQELIAARKAAEEEFAARVSEDNVHAEVQRRCALLQQHAEENANQVFYGAKEYADAILQDVQRYLMEYHQLVGKNRNELGVAAAEQSPVKPEQSHVKPEQSHVKPEQRPVQHAHVEPYTQPPSEALHATETEDIFFDEASQEPRKKRSIFRRNSERYLAQEQIYEDEGEAYDENEDMQEEAPPAKKRAVSRRMARREELDLDLEE